MASTKTLSAEFYAEQKGIYAILQHLALTLLEKGGEEAREEEAAATWQKSSAVGRRSRVPLRPQDPLAFLTNYVASSQGQLNLERSVKEYLSKRGINQNIHVREEVVMGRVKEERVPETQTVVAPSSTTDTNETKKQTARDGEENKAEDRKEEKETTLQDEVKREKKSENNDSIPTSGTAAAEAEQSQKGEEGSRLVQAEKETTVTATPAPPPNSLTPIKGETEPSEASPSAFTDDDTKANTKPQPVKGEIEQHQQENEPTHTDLEENEASDRYDTVPPAEAEVTASELTHTAEDAVNPSQPRMSSPEALATETQQQLAPEHGMNASIESSGREETEDDGGGAVEERRKVLVHSESANETREVESEKGRDVDEHEYGDDNDEEEAAVALVTKLRDEEHLRQAESERIPAEEM